MVGSRAGRARTRLRHRSCPPRRSHRGARRRRRRLTFRAGHAYCGQPAQVGRARGEGTLELSRRLLRGGGTGTVGSRLRVACGGGLTAFVLVLGGATAAAPDNALQLDGVNDYVTFGSAAGSLGASQFTLEAWFMRAGASGVSVGTGTGGLSGALPLVTKGRAEADSPANLNMNYFLGLDAATNKLVADFEDTAGGGNHPVSAASGTLVASPNVWHHAAASYDGSVWRLYLDGKLDRAVSVGSFTPESTSIQHAAIGSALTSTGSAAGFFAGQIDEVRIWNVARTGAQIRANKDSEAPTPTTGLRGQWHLDEGSGTSAGDSSGQSVTGALVGGPTWVAGYTFPQDTTAPAAPQNLAATAASGSVALSWSANGEPDLAGYNLWRSTSSPVDTSGSPLNGTDLIAPQKTSYSDSGLTNGTTYYYAVRAVDTADNPSDPAQASATPTAPSNDNALQVDGVNDFVTFGSAAGSLGASQFTLEAWFMRAGASGVSVGTGTGGLSGALPLVTKGRAEADSPANLNMNYFLGLDAATNKLVADFEDTAGGGNHPVSAASGTLVASPNVWHHAAASYDGAVWRLYLDGKLDRAVSVGSFTPESTSIQHAAIGSALTSTGSAAGFFAGQIDEVRIWNVARTGAQIRANKDSEAPTPTTGLRGQWHVDEGSGTSAGDSSGQSVTGALVGGPTWVAGYTFPQDTTAPAAPQNLAATAASGSVALSWSANGEPDLAGYNLWRSTSSPVDTSGSPLNGTDLIAPQKTSYSDSGLTNGTTYYYAVRAVDTADNPSDPAQASATPTAPSNDNALQVDGVNDFVTFGSAAGSLGASQFTLEAWFMRAGASGVSVGTGTGGLSGALPLVTKGRAEADSPANLNMNYFLGLDAATNKLVADFEDTAGGGNHPVSAASGTLVASPNVWHHAAASYDGSVWRLYLDGKLDRAVSVGSFTPESTSIQHAAIGSALTSTGSAAGFFAGQIDEVRIWNVARTGAQIRANKDSEAPTPTTGLRGQWHLDEGSGTSAGDSSGQSVTGALVGGPTWVAGYTFPQDTTAPAAPQNLAATAASGSVALSWSANGEPDLAGYNLWRSTSSPVDTSGSPLNGTDLIAPQKTSYSDSGLTNGTTYYYALVAVDTADNASDPAQASATPTVPSNDNALQLDGVNDFVTFGSAAGSLGASQFTLEAWFMRAGASGVSVGTGTGGLSGALPLVTKGRAEADSPANLNMNYFLGLDAATNKLVADFEDTAGGGNHPVSAASGTLVASPNVWHHAAASYDGSMWRLYLDGKLDRAVSVGSFTPESTSIQHAAIGSALTSTGSPAGFFAGQIDEVRIWNVARTGAQIRANKDSEAPTPTTGLRGQWHLDEGSGTSAGDSSGQSVTGALVGGPTWVAGYTFPQDTTAPAAPQNLAATAASGSVALSWPANGEPDLAGYNLWRSTSSPVDTSGSPLNGTDLIAPQKTSYSDSGLTNGTTYYYALVAVD